jgi:peptide/nickel transport system substrate-binding protein
MVDQPGNLGSHRVSDKVTRRGLLRSAGALGLGVAASPLLAACGGTSSPSGTSTNASGLVPRGGTIRVGMPGTGTGESFNPGAAGDNNSLFRVAAVFDQLTRPAPSYTFEPGLAIEWDHNKDSTLWEIKLRPGVTWHDGKPFTADDVIYTMRTMGSPSNFGHAYVENVRLAEIKKVKDHVVRIPLVTPDNAFDSYWAAPNSNIIQNGAKNFTKPIGTGAFKVESFVPGQRAVLVANKNYWEHPKPYLDRLEIIEIDDDNARLNALTGGQIDICSPLTPAQARASVSSRPSGWHVAVWEPGWNYNFYMRTDVAPFNDPRVRLAMKLIVNRPELISVAWSGFGVVSNDVYFGTDYNAQGLPQRTQDIPRAKALLKAAGRSDLTVTLDTAPINTGAVQAAQAFAQQAKAAGVTLNVRTHTTSAYFDPSVLYLKMKLGQDNWSPSSLASQYALGILPGGPYSETHWSDPKTISLFKRAVAASTHAETQELWNQLQKIQYDAGGNIFWGRLRGTDGISDRVRGISPHGSGWAVQPDNGQAWNWGIA